jgi:hypothetical protein
VAQLDVRFFFVLVDIILLLRPQLELAQHQRSVGDTHVAESHDFESDRSHPRRLDSLIDEFEHTTLELVRTLTTTATGPSSSSNQQQYDRLRTIASRLVVDLMLGGGGDGDSDGDQSLTSCRDTLDATHRRSGRPTAPDHADQEQELEHAASAAAAASSTAPAPRRGQLPARVRSRLIKLLGTWNIDRVLERVLITVPGIVPEAAAAAAAASSRSAIASSAGRGRLGLEAQGTTISGSTVGSGASPGTVTMTVERALLEILYCEHGQGPD